MTVEPVDLLGAKATLLMTLYLRDRDSRSRHPVLGDPYAPGLMARIDYPFRKLELLGNVTAVASRARRLDTWTAEFLAEHPAGQVLHLGCGLDSRPLRVDRPPASRWVDLDYPDVIDLRRRLYDLPESVETIAASVTDPGWWVDVADDRPTLIVAEGLFMYLDADQVHGLVDRALDRLPTGRLAFDGVAPWTVALTSRLPVMHDADARFSWGLEIPAFEARHPALTRLDNLSVTRLAAEATHNPLARAALAAVGALPPMRDAMRLLRYGFGPASS